MHPRPAPATAAFFSLRKIRKMAAGGPAAGRRPAVICRISRPYKGYAGAGFAGAGRPGLPRSASEADKAGAWPRRKQIKRAPKKGPGSGPIRAPR